MLREQFPALQDRLRFVWATGVRVFLGRFAATAKNDLIDVQYELGGRTTVATRLDIVAPSE